MLVYQGAFHKAFHVEDMLIKFKFQAMHLASNQSHLLKNAILKMPSQNWWKNCIGGHGYHSNSPCIVTCVVAITSKLYV